MSGRRSTLLPNREKSTTRRFDDDVVGHVGRRGELEVDGVTNATAVPADHDDDDDDDGLDARGEKMLSPAWTETARAISVQRRMRFRIVFILIMLCWRRIVGKPNASGGGAEISIPR